jgi:hypothetical protein
MEIISGVERRRRWRPEDKLRILAELEGGASLTEGRAASRRQPRADLAVARCTAARSARGRNTLLHAGARHARAVLPGAGV